MEDSASLHHLVPGLLTPGCSTLPVPFYQEPQILEKATTHVSKGTLAFPPTFQPLRDGFEGVALGHGVTVEAPPPNPEVHHGGFDVQK